MKAMSNSTATRLLVAIPCLNEARNVGDVIRSVPRELEGIQRVDILVVDDGSTDGTIQVAREAGARVIRHQVNRGVGAAFQTAVQHALSESYDLMINIDGDGQFNPADIAQLVEPIVAGEAEVTTASRFISPELTPDMPKVKLWGNRWMSKLISRLTRVHYHDVSCGFRGYSREALLHLNIHGAFTYTQESFLNFATRNIPIREVPVAVRYFDNRKSRVAGSIPKYAVNSAKIIFRSYRDYYPMRFFAAIALAFAVPGLGLAALFFTNYFLTGKFSGFLFAGFSAGFLLIVSMTFMVLGVVTDMLDRIRRNQEMTLYLLRKVKQENSDD